MIIIIGIIIVMVIKLRKRRRITGPDEFPRNISETGQVPVDMTSFTSYNLNDNQSQANMTSFANPSYIDPPPAYPGFNSIQPPLAYDNCKY